MNKALVCLLTLICVTTVIGFITRIVSNRKELNAQ